MDFFNSLRNYLGFPKKNENNNEENRNSTNSNSKNFRDEYTKKSPNHQVDDYDQLEVESHLDAIIETFRMLYNDPSLFTNNVELFFKDTGEPCFGCSQFPKHEDFQESSDNLRNYYLKPGYEEVKPNQQIQLDKDLDGRFDIGDLNSILKGESSRSKCYSYGQSMSTKTIQSADGTMETHKTVQDQHGNKEVTVIRRDGDKEYTITTKTDKDGHQEIIENFVNMDEKEKDLFLKQSPKSTIDKEKLSPNWFLYNKFF